MMDLLSSPTTKRHVYPLDFRVCFISITTHCIIKWEGKIIQDVAFTVGLTLRAFFLPL